MAATRGPDICMAWREELWRLEEILSEDESAVLRLAMIFARRNTNAIIMEEKGCFDPSMFRRSFWEGEEPVNPEKVLASLIERRIFLEETVDGVPQNPRRIYLNPFVAFNGASFERVNRYLTRKFGPLDFPSGGGKTPFSV